MNTLLWVLQALVGLAMIMAGTMKAFGDKEKLQPKMTWMEDFSASTVRLIGAAELAGGLGLVVPRLIGLPLLTPLAAACLAALMAGAAWTHVRRKDGMIAPSLVLGVLSAVIAVGRFF